MEAALLRKVLIANRGEIACRIAATLREMSLASVAVYSTADRGALHTRVADRAIELGPAEPRASYLNAEALLAAAKACGADAIHPGYGFLSENADFAAAVEAAGLVFVGPTAAQISSMGDKRAARELAAKAGVPVVPGASAKSADDLARQAAKLGFPVMVKAALGGGGKGMRAVRAASELDEAIAGAGRLAASAFGDGAVYLERALEHPRHLEVQVLGDGRGGAIHLFERECSLQRRHQKVIEECTAGGIDEALREKLTTAAVALAKAVKYRGAGTVEFLLASDGAYYFLEMNTRLQVEHPVTEMVTGVDLVRLQLEIAAGGALPPQSAIVRRGHAIEARLYAEDPAHEFLPQAGRVLRADWPRAPFVRVDRGVEAGDEVPVHYDPILAKIVAWGEDRPRALARLAQALDATCVHGVITNLTFLRALARSSTVASGAFDTEWIEREFLPGYTALAAAPAPELALAAAALAELLGAAAGPTPAAGVTQAPLADSDPFARLGRWRVAEPGV